ncbi:MAG: 30S ribosomal protein S17 [Deltaproteobacteria bacterium]|nr:30S ribosomal protein S17 [Deltaproteobacteria bacterium]
MAAESQAAVTQPVEPAALTKTRGARRRIVGVITSDKMQKTVVVSVTRRVRDPKFHKYVTKRVKYKVHDERDEYKVGDRVEIVETRPLSKDKRWRVARLIERPQEV